MNYIQSEALAKKKKTHLDETSSGDEESVYPEMEEKNKDPKALTQFQQYHTKQPMFKPKKFEKDLQDTFMFGDYVAPGLHTILVFDPTDQHIYYQQILVRMRKQE